MKKAKTTRVATASLASKLNFSGPTLVVVSLLAAIVGIYVITHIFASTFDPKAFLLQSAPGTTHEDFPHGVPLSYDWQSKATIGGKPFNRPNGDYYTNFWGEVYTNLSDAHPANTRVELKDCQYWGIMNGATTWTKLQAASLDGGAWNEDFSPASGGIDIRTESDGGQSVVPREGQNAHFWPQQGLYNTNNNLREAMSSCATRLVLANASGTDDRAQATYILAMGADWRGPNYECPAPNGYTICEGLGHGKYIKVTNSWRRAVFSSMSSTDLNNVPMPPLEAFVLPDGSYPSDMTVPTPTIPPTSGGKLNIVTAGDSIMAGSNGPGLRSNIFDNLKGAGLNFQFYGHKDSFWNGTAVETFTLPAAPNNRTASVGGTCLLANSPNGCGFNLDWDTSKGIWDLIDQTINEMGSTTPNSYFIMGGINDRFCNLGATDINAQGIMACRQPFSDRYKDFLDRVLTRTPNASIFFSTGRDFQNSDNFFDGVKGSLESLAASYRATGKKVYFIDAWVGVTSGDMSDSVHPNASGAAKVAANYTAVAMPLLNGGGPGPTTTPTPATAPTPTPSNTPVPTGPLGAGTYEEANASYDSTWATGGGYGQSGGADEYTSTVGGMATISFSGSGIRLYGAAAENGGQAQIKIDGTTVGTADYYAATRADQKNVFEKTNLTSGTHTLTLTMLSTHTGAGYADGKFYNTIDKFDILASVAATPTPTPVATPKPTPTATPKPSITPTPTPTPTCTKLGDVNCDSKVNNGDLQIVLAHYGKAVNSRSQGDLTGDGVVNVFDLSQVLQNWGR